MRTILLWLSLVALGVSTNACESGIDFYNVAPVVEALGPVCVDGSGRAWVYLSLVDYDGDPVDVDLEVSLDGGAYEPAALWGESGESPTLEVGALTCGGELLSSTFAPQVGYGTLGLPPNRQYPGALHVVVASLEAVGSATVVRVRATPDDRESGTGTTLESVEFLAGEGTATSTVAAVTDEEEDDAAPETAASSDE